MYFPLWPGCAKAEIERPYSAQDRPSTVPHREGKKERRILATVPLLVFDVGCFERLLLLLEALFDRHVLEALF